MQELLTALINQAQADGVQVYITGGIVCCGGKVLIVQRAACDNYLPNIWEVPGGKVDVGEDLIMGFHREMFEETGLKNLQIKRFTTTFDYLSRSGKFARQFNFLVECDVMPKIILDPAEHQNMAWVEPNLKALAAYDMTDHAKALIVSAFIARLT
jgi:8-oxo-dGTP pyrophosphatase MutT (NUDIX family)